MSIWACIILSSNNDLSFSSYFHLHLIYSIIYLKILSCSFDVNVRSASIYLCRYDLLRLSSYSQMAILQWYHSSENNFGSYSFIRKPTLEVGDFHLIRLHLSDEHLHFESCYWIGIILLVKKLEAISKLESLVKSSQNSFIESFPIKIFAVQWWPTSCNYNLKYMFSNANTLEFTAFYGLVMHFTS